MYSGELEVQAKRKALAVLQDEINRILNAGRVLSTLPKMLVKKDKTGIKIALEQISSTAEKLSAGELLQIEKSITKSMTEEIYFDMINQKTASLIATSCELGAITTSKTTKDRKATYEFGQNLGIAFQIKDDLFDLLGKESDTGKNSGGDVKKNMMTLPLIFSYSNMTKKENRKLKKLMGIKKKSRTILKEIRGIVDESGGFDYARKKLDDFSNNALDAISFYPDSPVKQSLLDLVTFNALRVK